MPKILAIDYGTKNIGLALSDDEQKFAFAYNTIKSQKSKVKSQKLGKIISDIKNICKIEKVQRVIVGMPINLSGDKTKTTEKVFEFVKELEENLTVPVEVEDERLTTVQASRLKNKTARNINELSAQILLQGYLDKIAHHQWSG